ncbi:hypothetical protein MTO96_012598 [Rhipicephalus appendiculatus]
MGIDRIKSKRAVVRTSTIKLLNDIAAMEADASLGELQEKINLLTLKEDSLKELDREIENGVGDDALEEEIACSENYKEKISIAKTKLQRMLRDHIIRELPSAQISSVQSTGAASIFKEEEAAATKVLGVGWNAHTDNFKYNLTSLLEFLATRADGKRFVLQVSTRIFDPFGFIAPTTLCVKRMFQRLWEFGAGWDDPLPAIMQAEWDCWCKELQCIKAVSIPRIIARDFRDEETEKVLHIFSDASPKAYGAVAYVACKSPLGIINISLIMAKSRVAPSKHLSLP